MIEGLKTKSIAELKAMVATIDKELASRAAKEKKAAKDEIKKLAKKAGLDVQLSEKPKRQKK